MRDDAGTNENGELPMEGIVRLFEGTQDGVYVVDADQRVVFWNSAAERITGLAADQALGRRCYELMAATDYDGLCYCRKDCATIQCVRRGETVQNYEVLARPGSSKVWLSTSIIVANVSGYDGPLGVHIIRDVTKRRTVDVLAADMISTVSRMPDPVRFEGDEETPSAVQPVLTAREREVLTMLASGVSVRAIAHELVLSPPTVRNHIENLMGKMGVHTRLQAVVAASRLGLL